MNITELSNTVVTATLTAIVTTVVNGVSLWIFIRLTRSQATAPLRGKLKAAASKINFGLLGNILGLLIWGFIIAQFAFGEGEATRLEILGLIGSLIMFFLIGIVLLVRCAMILGSRPRPPTG